MIALPEPKVIKILGDRFRRRYGKTLEYSLGGIPTFVFDPHNEALLFWHQYAKRPSVLLHIDDHPDRAITDSFSYVKETTKIETFLEYAMRYVHRGSFIMPAFHEGIINVMYSFSPYRPNQGDSNGRILNGEVVPAMTKVIERGNIVFEPDSPFFTKLTLNDIIKDFSSIKYLDYILDIDLDAFMGIHDSRRERKRYVKRIEQISYLLHRIPRPQLITIARSQNPDSFVPREFVDTLEAAVLDMVNGVFSRK